MQKTSNTPQALQKILWKRLPLFVIWSAFFDIDPAAPLKKQMRALEKALDDYAPDRLQAMPLLKSVLDMDIPENDFTSSLEPQYRKSALTALFEDCLRAASKEEPVLIVVEDVHWIDALSHDLLEDLAKALVDYPVCFVLAYRPPQLMRLQAPRLEVLPQFTKIELHELSRPEAEQAIRALNWHSYILPERVPSLASWWTRSWNAPRAIPSTWRSCSTNCATAASTRAILLTCKRSSCRTACTPWSSAASTS